MKRTFLTCIVILMMTVFLTGCNSSKYAEYAEEIIAKESSLMQVDSDDYLWRKIADAKDNKAFEKQINKAILAVKGREDLNQKFEGGALTRLAQVAVFLERVGYTKESTKEAFKEAIRFWVEKEMQYDVGRIIYCLQYFDYGEYYGNAQDYLSVEVVKDYLERRYITKAFEAKDLSGFTELLMEVEDILSYLDYMTAADLLDYDAIKAHVSSNFTQAIIQNGKGGYYDNLQDNYQNSHHTDDNLTSHSKSHYFHGDFRSTSSSSKAYRPTGEDWEDKVLSKYDSSSTTIYYKETQLNGTGDWLDTYSGKSDAVVYITLSEKGNGEYDVIIFGNNYIGCFYAHVNF